MDKKHLLVIAIALLGSVTINNQALAQRAVIFNGSVYLFTQGINAPPSASEGVGSFWWGTTAQNSAGFIGVYPNAFNNMPSMAISTLHIPGSGERLVITLSDAGQPNQGGHFQRWVGGIDLPHDDQPHHISYAWNSLNQTAVWSLDAASEDWDHTLTRTTGGGFSVNFAGNNGPARWFVGGMPSNNFVPEIINLSGTINLYLAPVRLRLDAWLSELYFKSGDDLVDDILNPFRTGQGFALLTDGYFGPLEMGPGCISIFGTGKGLPQVCLRGNASYFPLNQGGATSFVVQGTLKTATLIDPFDLW